MKNIDRKTVTIGMIGVFLIAGTLVYSSLRNQNVDQDKIETANSDTKVFEPSENTKFDDSPPSSSENDEINKQKSTAQPTATPKPTAPGETASPKSSVAVTIIQVGQDNPGQEVVIKSIVNGTEKGECTISLNKGSDTIVKKGMTSLQTSYYSCPTIRIPLSEFPQKGSWSAQIIFESEHESGRTEASNFEVL